MLVINRKSGQGIHINDDIRIVVLEVRGGQVRLGLDAPRKFIVLRDEIYDAIKRSQQEAAQGGSDECSS